MNILLGNLSINEIEKRCGVKFPDELVKYMQERKQESVSNSNIKSGKWHCFDMPFNLVCGDMETATNIYRYLESMSKEFKEKLQISLNTF